MGDVERARDRIIEDNKLGLFSVEELKKLQEENYKKIEKIMLDGFEKIWDKIGMMEARIKLLEDTFLHKKSGAG